MSEFQKPIPLTSAGKIAMILGVIGVLVGCNSPGGRVDSKSCASPETFDALKEIIFDDVKQNFRGEVKYVNDLEKSFSLSVEIPTLEKIEKDIKKVECEGRILLKVPNPYYELFDRENILTSDIGYSVQPSADGDGYVYALGGYEGVLNRLLQGAYRLEAREHDKKSAVSPNHPQDSTVNMENESAQESTEVAPDNTLLSNNFWSHNGSVVRLFADGSRRSFYYETPKDGIPVVKGDLLFHGTRNGNFYSGTAYRFSSTCGKVSYKVSGNVSADQSRISLRGLAPKRDKSCNIIGEFNDNLVFNFIKQ